MRPLAEQVQIETRKDRAIAVRIVDLARRSVFPHDAHAIIEGFAIHGRHDDLEQAIAVNACEGLQGGGAECLQLHTARTRTEDANGKAVGHLVRAKHRKRVAVSSTNDRVDVGLRHAPQGSLSTDCTDSTDFKGHKVTETQREWRRAPALRAGATRQRPAIKSVSISCLLWIAGLCRVASRLAKPGDARRRCLRASVTPWLWHLWTSAQSVDDHYLWIEWSDDDKIGRAHV